MRFGEVIGELKKNPKQKIKCHIPGCENDALILFGNIFICGKCFEELQRVKQEKEEEETQKMVDSILKKREDNKEVKYNEVVFG